MATTSPEAARRLLDRLHAGGFSGALLHGAERIEQGDLHSDLDLVCEAPMARALEEIEAAAAVAGLVPVLLWPYDVNAVTVLAVQPRWQAVLPAVQVDLLVDPPGLGKYGLRTDLLVRDAVASGRFRTVSALDQSLYLWRKSRTKAQLERLRNAEEALRAFEPSEVRARAEAVFRWGPAPLSAEVPCNLAMRLRRLSARLRRLAWRTVTPIGCELADLPDDTRTEFVPAIQGAFPHVIEWHSRVPFRWSLAARKPLLAISGSAKRTPPGAAHSPDALIRRLHENYRLTVPRYTSSRLVSR